MKQSILAVALIFAFLVRVVFPWQFTFSNGILLNTPDAYIMLHYADLWPNFPAWDWYTNYPIGIASSHYEVFVSLIAVLGRVFNASNMMVGAFLPVGLFFLTLIPVYVTARTLFDDNVGIGSVVIFCLLSGELLARTMLGAADYHCWEILLFALTMMFVVLAMKRHRLYWVCALEFMVLYWFSWAGALVIPFTVITGILLFAFLSLKRWYWRGLVVVCCVGVVLAVYLAFPVLFQITQTVFTWDLNQTNMEMMPLFFSQGQFNIDTMWAYFGPVFYFALFGMGWFTYRTWRYKRAEDCLFLAWTLIALFMMLAMRRFAYYWAFNASVLSVYACVEYVKSIKNKETLATNIIALVLLICAIPMSLSIQASLKNQFTMTRDWQATVQWLRTQSNDKVYYSGGKPEYGVFTWWTYGYWIITEGHQATLGTPGFADGHRASTILMSSDVKGSLAELHKLNMRYVIIDKDMILRDVFSIADDAHKAGIENIDYGYNFERKLWEGEFEGIKQVQQFGDVKVFELKP
jgi:asparagine N-glycosylation enzyme membrane subunit Stt3